jgi:O-methyltransferase
VLKITRARIWHFRNRLIERFARWGDRFLYDHRLAWLNDKEWVSPYRKYLEADRLPNQPSTRILDRRFVLIKLAERVRDLDGSTAEFGVREGVGSALICKALQGTYKDSARHLGFDSFEGLPEPTPRDKNSKGQISWFRGGLKIPLESATHYLSDFEHCQLVKGWIPETLGPFSDETFRFIHVDVDLYKSTVDSLEFAYPRMVNGGIILFDDYGFDDVSGARNAVNEFFSGRPETVFELPTGQAFVQVLRPIKLIL